MAYNIKKVDVWAGEIADRPGGLGATVEALSSAGANLEFLISRRAPDRPGTGVVFLTPIKGTKQKNAAQRPASVLPIACIRFGLKVQINLAWELN